MFYGDDSDSYTKSSRSWVGDDLRAERDSMTQSVVCGDINGDEFDDVAAGGQNAGPDLEPGSTGMVAIFHGSADGLAENEATTITPVLKENKQYFGASLLLYEDNLIVGGWGLKKDAQSVNSGGVFIYDLGSDLTEPAYSLFPEESKEMQFGSKIKIVNEYYLGVLAPNGGTNGELYIYDLLPKESEPQLATIIQPTEEELPGGSLTDFALHYRSSGKQTHTLLLGAKYANESGVVLSTMWTTDYKTPTYQIFSYQNPRSGDGFGSMITVVGDIDGDDVDDIIVGIPEHIEE